MSRNKDIKLKENDWDLLEALDFGDVLRSNLVDSVVKLTKELVNSLERVAEILNNLKCPPSMPLPELPDYTIKEERR